MTFSYDVPTRVLQQSLNEDRHRLYHTVKYLNNVILHKRISTLKTVSKSLLQLVSYKKEQAKIAKETKKKINKLDTFILSTASSI